MYLNHKGQRGRSSNVLSVLKCNVTGIFTKNLIRKEGAGRTGGGGRKAKRGDVKYVIYIPYRQSLDQAAFPFPGYGLRAGAELRILYHVPHLDCSHVRGVACFNY